MNLSLNSVFQYAISFIDILIVSLIIYAILRIVQSNEKTLRIFKGAIVVIIVDFIANLAHLTTLRTITQNLINWGFLVFIIIFQPEIRSFLERIGKTSIRKYRLINMNDNEYIANELTKSVTSLSKSSTGALITIEREISLQEFIDAGVYLDSDISSQLINTIFMDKSPLHDGAMIISHGKIAATSTYFPPPLQDVNQIYGARHRAAVGISEISDSLTIVVSEETGYISLVEFGNMQRIDPASFYDELLERLNFPAQDPNEKRGELNEA
jgi:diadenylate cyclase